MKNYIILISILALFIANSIGYAQVSIGNVAPKGTFDIEVKNKSNPSATDGLLIPRISAFPSTAPGADQDGMLVYLTTNLNGYRKGIHYWDNDSALWTPFGGQWVSGYNAYNEKLIYAKQAAMNGVDVVLLDGGGLGMGTDDPDESLELKFEGDNDIQISSASPPNAPNLIYFTIGNTFSVPRQLRDGDPIGSIQNKVWTGSGKSFDVGNITSAADGDHSPGNLPTRFNFSVTANGDDSEDDSGMEMTIRQSGRVGIGKENPTALLHLKAGTTAANSAPIKFTSGTKLTTPETGAIEYDGTHLYFTPNTSRKLLLKGLKGTAALNFPNITVDNSAELTVAVPGATTGSSCNCSPYGAIEVGLKWSCYISAPNTATIRLSNVQNTAVDPASKNWKVTVIE